MRRGEDLLSSLLCPRFIRVEKLIESADVDRYPYKTIATESAAPFKIIEEVWRGTKLFKKHPVKDQIRPEMAVVQDDCIP